MMTRVVLIAVLGLLLVGCAGRSSDTYDHLFAAPGRSCGLSSPGHQ
jgi:hypothetical protein